MKRAFALLATVAVLAPLAACRQDSVGLAFRPPAGAATTFISSSVTRTETDVPGRAPDVELESVLRVNQRVVESGVAGALIDVEATFITVTQNGLAAPTPDPVNARFQVDTAGHAVNLSATVAASDTARQGLPEITAPFPVDRVRPGQEWGFPPPVGRPGFGGTARLLRLGVRDGRPVAEIEARLSTEQQETELRGRDGPVTIGGPLDLVLRGVYDIDTGMLVESHEELTGNFRLRFTLQGSTTPPVAGTQKLTVLTDTRRG